MKKRFLALMLAVAVMLTVLPAPASAATTWQPRNGTELDEALTVAADGDVIKITTALELTDTVEIPAKEVTFYIMANVTSSNHTVFQISSGANVQIYLANCQIKSIEKPSWVFDNAGNLALINLGGVVGSGSECTVARNASGSSFSIVSGGTYYGDIQADSGATVQINYLGDPSFSVKPDPSFLVSGCEFVEQDGFYQVVNNNVVEFQYRKYSDTSSVEYADQHLTLQVAEELESAEIYGLKYQLLLDCAAGVTFDQPYERTILLNSHTITGDVVVSRGSLIITDPKTTPGAINGTLTVSTGTSVTLNNGTIAAAVVDGKLTIGTNATATITSLQLDPGGSIETAKGTITNETAKPIVVSLVAQSSEVKLTLPVQEPVAERGMMFVSWQVGDGSEYSCGTELAVDGNLSITAKTQRYPWTAEAEQNVITMHYNGGVWIETLTLSVGDVTYGTAVEASVTAASTFPAKVGDVYYEGAGDTVYEKSLTPPTQAGTYRATVTVTIPDGTVYTAEQAFSIHPAAQDKPAVTAVNETIAGKNDGQIVGLTSAMELRGEGESSYIAVTDQTNFAVGTYYVRYAAYGNYSASEDTKVVIEPGRKLTVTFQTNGGTAVAQQLVNWGGFAQQPEDPNREGYAFDSWYADAELTEPFDFSGVIGTDVVVYAGWMKLVDVAIDVSSARGGTITCEGDPIPQLPFKAAVPANSKTTLTAAANDGYIFTGWEINGKTVSTEPTLKLSLTEDMTIRAVFASKQYTVTYMAAGTLVAAVQVAHGADAAAPAVPAKDGYTGAWDNSGKAITADTQINAVYTAVAAAPASGVPNTGDSSAVVLWSGVLAVSALALAVLLLSGRKKAKRG